MNEHEERLRVVAVAIQKADGHMNDAEARSCARVAIAALESGATPPAGTDAARLYDLRAYLAKTLDNIEEDTRGWTIGDVSAFIVSALELDDPELSPNSPAAGDPERKALRGVIGGVLCNASNFPEKVASRILGQDMGPLMDRTVDALIAAGYAKPETERVAPDMMRRRAAYYGVTKAIDDAAVEAAYRLAHPAFVPSTLAKNDRVHGANGGGIIVDVREAGASITVAWDTMPGILQNVASGDLTLRARGLTP